MFNSKVFLAEFIGTFALTFIGAAAGMSGAGLVAVALAHGFTLAVFAYAYGNISGSHVNPAVTFGLWLNGTVKGGRALVSYVIPQLLGAAFAGFILYSISGDISDQIPLSRTTVSQHLQELKKAGLIQGTIDGLKINYCLCSTEIAHFLKQFDDFFGNIKTSGISCCTGEDQCKQ